VNHLVANIVVIACDIRKTATTGWVIKCCRWQLSSPVARFEQRLHQC